MSAKGWNGRAVRVLLDGQALAAVQSKRFNFTAEAIDITDGERNGFRRLCERGDVLDVQAQVEGVATAANYQLLLSLWSGDISPPVELQYPDGVLVTGKAFLSGMSSSGEHDGHVSFSATLTIIRPVIEASGGVIIIPGGGANGSYPRVAPLLSAMQSGVAVRVVWSAAVLPTAIIGYDLYRRLNSGTFELLVELGTELIYLDEGTGTPGDFAAYYVVARAENGDTITSNTDDVVIPNNTPLPDPDVGITAGAGPGGYVAGTQDVVGFAHGGDAGQPVSDLGEIHPDLYHLGADIYLWLIADRASGFRVTVVRYGYSGGAPVPVNSFTSIQINGNTYLTASASTSEEYTGLGYRMRTYDWGGQAGLVDGVFYPVVVSGINLPGSFRATRDQLVITERKATARIVNGIEATSDALTILERVATVVRPQVIEAGVAALGITEYPVTIVGGGDSVLPRAWTFVPDISGFAIVCYDPRDPPSDSPGDTIGTVTQTAAPDSYLGLVSTLFDGSYALEVRIYSIEDIDVSSYSAVEIYVGTDDSGTLFDSRDPLTADESSVFNVTASDSITRKLLSLRWNSGSAMMTPGIPYFVKFIPS